MVTYRAYFVWLRNFTVYLTYLRSSLVSNIGEPILYLMAMGYGIGKFIPEMGGMSYVEFIAPGLLIAGVMYSAVFECTFGSFTRMTHQRTYDSILSTPLSVEDLVAGEILWGMTKSVISAMAVLLVMTLLGIYKPGLSFFPLVALVCVSGFLFASLAMLFSAMAPDYQFFNYFFTLLVTPMFIFSGVFFPLNEYGSVVINIANILPTTHSVNISRSLFYGGDDISIYAVLYLVILSALLGHLAMLKVKKRVIK